MILNINKGGNMSKTVVAICYDFDKTLATSNMQEFSFIPNLGLSINEFWDKCDNLAEENGSDMILNTMRFMIDRCKEKGIKLTKEYLYSLGKDVKFFNGVESWFDRINKYAKSKDIVLEHYIISSGNKEIIEGCPIYDKFKNVYGCEYLYDENGEAYWPKRAVNYTLKTQYLFKICKGIDDNSKDEKVNDRVNKKHVEFRNMIYIGDGITDVPCMTLVKEKGGTAISVYPEGEKDKSVKLLKDNRVNYACVSDYGENSEIEQLMQLILNSISLKEKLIKKESNQKL